MENDEKIKIIEQVRLEKDKAKSFKISVKRFENDLLYEQHISMDILKSLCLLFDIYMIVIYKKLIMVVNPKDDVIPFILERCQSDYKLRTDITHDFVKDIMTKNYFGVTSLVKPFNSCSSYKLSELQNIVDTLGLPINQKDRKIDLYNKLVDYI
jgi:hypothetical protein